MMSSQLWLIGSLKLLLFPVQSIPAVPNGRISDRALSGTCAGAYDPTRGEIGSFGVLQYGSCGYTQLRCEQLRAVSELWAGGYTVRGTFVSGQASKMYSCEATARPGLTLWAEAIGHCQHGGLLSLTVDPSIVQSLVAHQVISK
jgi:hypothetical protein